MRHVIYDTKDALVIVSIFYEMVNEKKLGGVGCVREAPIKAGPWPSG